MKKEPPKFDTAWIAIEWYGIYTVEQVEARRARAEGR